MWLWTPGFPCHSLSVDNLTIFILSVFIQAAVSGGKALVLQSLWGPMTQCTLTLPSLEAENSFLLPSHPSPDSPQAQGYYFHGSGSEDVWPWWFMVLFSMWREMLLLVLTHKYRHPTHRGKGKTLTHVWLQHCHMKKRTQSLFNNGVAYMSEAQTFVWMLFYIPRCTPHPTEP